MGGVIMQPEVEVLTPPQLPDTPVIACYRCEVQDFALEDIIFADADEVSSFVTDKRRMEHLSGRWLLQYSLIQWGIESGGMNHCLVFLLVTVMVGPMLR